MDFRIGAWQRRPVRKRGRFRRRHRGPEQSQALAQRVARAMVRSAGRQPQDTDRRREIESPWKTHDGRPVWYPLEVYPPGSDIDSTVRAGGRAVELHESAGGRAGVRASLICLRHTDPHRRRIWCSNWTQARIEMARHGLEDGRDMIPQWLDESNEEGSRGVA